MLMPLLLPLPLLLLPLPLPLPLLLLLPLPLPLLLLSRRKSTTCPSAIDMNSSTTCAHASLSVHDERALPGSTACSCGQLSWKHAQAKHASRLLQRAAQHQPLQ
jgi:hypothetical protein